MRSLADPPAESIIFGERERERLLRQYDSNTPAPYVLDVRRAAAKLLLCVVVVMAWRAMPLRLLKFMAGLGRAVPRAAGRTRGGHQAPCESPAAS